MRSVVGCGGGVDGTATAGGVATGGGGGGRSVGGWRRPHPVTNRLITRRITPTVLGLRISLL
jgi:hypothetical protein